MVKLLVGLYAGEIFSIVFIVSYVLFKKLDSKNLAGRIYGQILWRFYKIALLELLLVFILNISFYTFFMLLGLLANIYLSYYTKSLKQSLGDIDKIDINDPRRIKFRKVSKTSSFLLVFNMILAIFYILR
ncbi:hypothetical protein HY04AAS1_0478 [Hydrogenobaculum sp. Y04AAS1]|uniref:hypothetical protein n=1 Tax=Hydrogenobaculum sp. (strain Y04AAS1) TaxID=380749 RepID=UPI00015BCB54|nr:hypothetical protein HY04AAS1_0478 [Hydrogenobaculum sp. Y04AAS1]HCT66437.1 hypothetical protein [Hydrogenobaculum sp.]